MEMNGGRWMRRRVIATVGLLLAGVFRTGGAQTPEERAAARDLLAKRSDAVVMVLATVKIRMSTGGHEQTGDQPVEVNATVLDATGIAVASLSTLQPESMMARMAQRSGAAQPQMSSELTDLRIRLADGREVPAQIVLRDPDLDLAFLRPTEPAATPMPSMSGPSGKPSTMDLVIGLRRTNEATGWRPAASFGYVQIVIERPRTYYLVTGGNALGSPLFDTSGRFVGVTVMRNAGGRAGPSLSVLTADEIREMVKQVPGKS